MLKVRCLKESKFFNCVEDAVKQKSCGALSINCNSSLLLLMIVVRLPHAKMDAKKPAISMSCFFVKRCGMQTGSAVIKDG